jgi:hypothetical protein
MLVSRIVLGYYLCSHLVRLWAEVGQRLIRFAVYRYCEIRIWFIRKEYRDPRTIEERKVFLLKHQLVVEVEVHVKDWLEDTASGDASRS